MIEAMKIVADAEQIRYFKEHGLIQFDEVLSTARLDEMNEAVDQVLAKRTGANRNALPKLPPAEIYPYARDLWRESEVIKKFDCQSRFADLLLSFFSSQKFLLGTDQLLVPDLPPSITYEPYYPKAFPEPKPLREQISIQGVHSALFVCLKGDSEEENSAFPTRPGSVVVMGPEYPLPLGELKANLTRRLLWITYVNPDAVYLYRESDPGTHYWKNLGYVFGDKLMQKGHPPIRL